MREEEPLGFQMLSIIFFFDFNQNWNCPASTDYILHQLL